MLSLSPENYDLGQRRTNRDGGNGEMQTLPQGSIMGDPHQDVDPLLLLRDAARSRWLVTVVPGSGMVEGYPAAVERAVPVLRGTLSSRVATGKVSMTAGLPPRARVTCPWRKWSTKVVRIMKNGS